jgi:hypothetical protein
VVAVLAGRLLGLQGLQLGDLFVRTLFLLFGRAFTSLVVRRLARGNDDLKGTRLRNLLQFLGQSALRVAANGLQELLLDIDRVHYFFSFD